MRTNQPHRRQALLVAGMHRSGTSALGGVLAALGAQAPKSLMSPTKDNPRGYWESTALMQFNEKVLASAGSAWHDWGRFNPYWLDSPAAEEFLATLPQLIEEEFGAASLLLIKDPRICRLMPLWLRVLRDMDIEPKIVLPIRDPFEVVRSLEARNTFISSRSMLIWLRHVLDSELDSRGVDRVFTRYSDVLQNWQAEMRRLSEVLGVAWPKWSVDTEVVIDQFLSTGLRHHVIAEEEATGPAEALQWIRLCSDAFSRLVDDSNDTQALATLDGVRSKFDRSSEVYAAIARESELRAAKEVRQREREAADASQKLSASEAQLQELAARHEADMTGLAERLKLSEQTREAEVQQQLTQAKDRAAVLEGDLGKMRALGDAREAELQLQLQQAQDTAAALATAAATELQQARDAAAALERDLEEARELLKKQDAELALRQSELDAERKRGERIAPLEEELTAARQATAARFQEIAQLTRMLRDREIANSALETQRTRAADDARKLAGQVRALRAAAKEAQARRSQQDEDIHELRLQLFGQEKRLALRESELARLKSSKSWKMTALLRKLRGGGGPSGIAPGDLELVRVAGLFDADWYLEQNPDVAVAGLDPAEHYLLHGAAEGRDPGPWFSTAFYLTNYPDVAAAGTNPLVHFVRHGSEEGRACRNS